MYVFVVGWFPSLEVDTVTDVQVLDDTVCISHSANTLRKDMNPTIFPPDIGK